VGWHVAARSSLLDEGGVLGVEVNGLKVALYRIESKVYATSNLCTHEVALLSEGYVDGDCIECPLHQALFHIPTGEVRVPPANEPIPTYPAKEEVGSVLINLPE
jgi:nitrite reductase/ring-hydroxylating ferredoxin subunit